MTHVSTDREAVERLAARAEEAARDYREQSDCCGQRDHTGTCAAPACRFGEVMRGLQDGAATLRALRAALDAALAAVEAARRKEREACRCLAISICAAFDGQGDERAADGAGTVADAIRARGAAQGGGE